METDIADPCSQELALILRHFISVHKVTRCSLKIEFNIIFQSSLLFRKSFWLKNFRCISQTT